MRNLSPLDLKAYLDQTEPAPLLIDVREPWEFQIARIEGARLVPLNTVPRLLDELEPDQELVVICHHGVRSRHAAFFLEQNGFTRVINLAGGIDAWSRQVDPSIPVY